MRRFAAPEPAMARRIVDRAGRRAWEWCTLNRGMLAETGPPAIHPARLGVYDVLVPIASGGTATVYLARRRGVGGFEREVAIKVVHPHLRDEDLSDSALLAEARLAAGIRHPNVVQVVDVDTGPFGPYLVMEYVEGDSLAALRRAATESNEPIPLPVSLRILCDALAGLHAAHELRNSDNVEVGLVHRDVSPQNVLVGIDGMSRLVDFGIAKASSRKSMTQTGVVRGKVGYMAPEQLLGEPLDRRCDIWGAGVVAWELFARRRLHPPGEDFRTGLRVITTAPPRLRSVDPGIPPGVDAAVASALVLKREARCSTAAELRARLAEAGPLAEVGEVGEYVARVLEAPLARRRLAVARARRIDGAQEAQLEETTTVVEAGRTSPNPAGRWKRATASAAGVGIVAVAFAVGLRARGRDSAPAPGGAALATVAAAPTESAPANGPSASAATTDAPPASTASSPSVSAPPAPRVRSVQRSRGAPTASPAETAAARSPARPALAGNPYP